MHLSACSTVATKTKRPIRNMSAQTKLEAIRRVHAGESKASVARSIDVPESTLRGWCKNEEKILYVSRQSSPETDESSGQFQPKKIKLEEHQRMQPFDFSLTMNGSRSCSPDVALDYSKSGPNSSNQPLNLTATLESSNTATQATDTETNRITYARRLELGLNRPQFCPTSSNVSVHQTDLNASVVAQWRAIMMQQQQLSLATIKSTDLADTINMAFSSGGLFVMANQENARYLPRERQTVHDFVWNRLKSQHINQTQAQLATPPSINGVVSPTSTVSPTMNGIDPTQSSLMWKWHDPKTIFSQQLTRDAHQNVSSTPQQPASKDNRLRNHNGNKLLGNLLFHGNNVKQEPLGEGTTWQEAIGVKQEPLDEGATREEAIGVKQEPLDEGTTWQEAIGVKQESLDEGTTREEAIGVKQEPLDEGTSREEAIGKLIESKNIFDRVRSHKGKLLLDSLLFNSNNVKLKPLDDFDGTTRREGINHGEQFLAYLESHSIPSVNAMHILEFRKFLFKLKGVEDKKNFELRNKRK